MSNHDPLDLAGQAKQQAERETREQLLAKTEATDIAWLVKSKQGRRIAWRLLEQAGVFRTSFNTNSMAMAFAEGARNSGLRLLTLIPPESYVQMLNEAKDK